MILYHDWEPIKDDLPDDATHICVKCKLRVIDPTTVPQECSGRPGLYEPLYVVEWPVVRLANEVEALRNQNQAMRGFLSRVEQELAWCGNHKVFEEGGEAFEGWCKGPQQLFNDIFNFLHKEKKDARTGGA